MPTDPSHILFHQRNERERKILKNKAFIDAFGPPSQIKTKKSSNSSSSKSSSNTFNTPGHQSSDYRSTTDKTKASTLKIVSNRLVPNIEALIKKYPDIKPLPSTIVDLPDVLLRDIMIKANLQNKYVLRAWIKIEDLNIDYLCLNPNAISFLNELYEKTKTINWNKLSSNPNAMYLIKKRIADENNLTAKEIDDTDSNYIINWYNLSSNPNAIDVLKKKIEEEKEQGERIVAELNDNRKIHWSSLSANPNAILLLKENQEKIVWNGFYMNTNLDIDLFEKRLLQIKTKDVVIENLEWYSLWSIPISKAIDLLNTHFPKKINYYCLSQNKCTSAINLLLINKENIVWNNLSLNTHPKAIELLTNNKENIDWSLLAKNKAAIKIIEDNISTLPDRIWYFLSSNPKAIKLLEANLTKINITALCRNHNAVKLIKMHKDKLQSVHYRILSTNPCIFIERRL